MVSKEEAIKHIKKSSENGLVHLIGRNKLDVMWLGANPGDQLMTICNCCPCCCLWKMLPDIDPQIRSKVNKMPGVKVSVDHDLCTGCGKCSEPEICFADAIHLHNKKSIISEECRGCGRCVHICPRRAISLNFDPSNSVLNIIEELNPLVNVAN